MRQHVRIRDYLGHGNSEQIANALGSRDNIHVADVQKIDAKTYVAEIIPLNRSTQNRDRLISEIRKALATDRSNTYLLTAIKDIDTDSWTPCQASTSIFAGRSYHAHHHDDDSHSVRQGL